MCLRCAKTYNAVADDYYICCDMDVNRGGDSLYPVAHPVFSRGNALDQRVLRLHSSALCFNAFFESGLNRLDEEQDLGNICFLQDGASAHTAQSSITKLRQMLPVRLAFLRGVLG